MPLGLPGVFYSVNSYTASVNPAHFSFPAHCIFMMKKEIKNLKQKSHEKNHSGIYAIRICNSR